MQSVDQVFVTASMTAPGMTGPELEWNHRQQGFFKLACHAVIAQDGTVYTGRRTFEEAGCLAGALNATSLQVVLIGGVDDALRPTDNFTAAQKRELAKLRPDLPRVIDKQSPIKEL